MANQLKFIALLSLLPVTAAVAQTRWTEKKSGDVVFVTNTGGQNLGYSATSGVKILTVDGLAFKDLNKNGKLDKYEDWRLPVDVRAKDLASKMSVEQIAGLMLYSKHQPIPAAPAGPARAWPRIRSVYWLMLARFRFRLASSEQ